MNKKTVQKLLKAAQKPSELARKMHPFYKGKIEIVPKCRVKNFDDFSVWYSPGVAAVCKDIAARPELVYQHTNKGNSVAVVSDGTRVLGLGDIGAEASMPVMEGKALLFKYLGGVDAYPICLDTKDTKQIIDTVKILQPSFGGINLEDISQPKCYEVLDTLRKECRIPVWHDDQQGTALV
ncbi:MAG: malate dehydrogenase, partial [Elusimicrobia bacterium]|nr:malate dehydrogenase [Elusimicrobiota bacterium]